MRMTAVEIHIVEVPQIAPIAPYRSHVRTSSTTQSAIVLLRTDEGLSGCGEFNVNFLPDISARAMQATASQWMIGRDALNVAAFHQECPLETRLKSGVEIAMWDLRGKAAGMSVAELLGGVIRPQVELAGCMGIQSYERAGEIASWFVENGFTTLKTKAGSDIDEDVEMVRGIRDAVGDQLKLRIDPNRAYSLDEATELHHRVREFDLQYVEQPIAAEPLSDARTLRRASDVPLALNESVVGPTSVLEILREEAAEFLLPDTHIAGGIQPCVATGRLCEAADLPCIMHCGHDLGPKTAAMLHIAAACPSYSLANDSTYYGLEDDVITEALRVNHGRMAVPTAPGLGVEIDMEKIARYRIDC